MGPASSTCLRERWCFKFIMCYRPRKIIKGASESDAVSGHNMELAAGIIYQQGRGCGLEMGKAEEKEEMDR